jgi:predicted nucleic acid-binding protein
VTVVKVVDASALAAILFQEAGWQDVVPRLQGAVLAAPELLRNEILNIAWKKIRRAPEMRAVNAAAVLALDDFKFTYHTINIQQILPLALDTGLTGYDASYLWLARALGAELVTLDARLDAVATARS